MHIIDILGVVAGLLGLIVLIGIVIKVRRDQKILDEQTAAYIEQHMKMQQRMNFVPFTKI